MPDSVKPENTQPDVAQPGNGQPGNGRGRTGEYVENLGGVVSADREQGSAGASMSRSCVMSSFPLVSVIGLVT